MDRPTDSRTARISDEQPMELLDFLEKHLSIVLLASEYGHGHKMTHGRMDGVTDERTESLTEKGGIF